jgi:uncharacterized BrkB/YihY/UPF0761 family membrane protein
VSIRSRIEALPAWAEEARRQTERVPGSKLVYEVLATERRVGGPLIEAGVAFRLFLWLVPFGLVVAALLSLWSDVSEQGLENEARKFGISAAAASGGAKALTDASHDIYILIPFGIVALAWFTLGALRALVLAFSLAWGLEPAKIRRPLLAILFFNVVYVVGAASGVAVAWLRAQVGAGAAIGIVLSVLVVMGLALVAMWFLPHPPVRFRDLLPGAVLIGIGNQVVSVVVVYYFAPRLGRAEAAYGAFGTAAVLLVWLYVEARLAVGAAFLNAVVHRRRTAEAVQE